MTTDQENELFKRAQVIKAKCEEYIKYNYGTNDGAFALGIELLASGQLFTEAAGHTCQPATAENHLMFGIKMTKEESAIIGLILKKMHEQFSTNNKIPYPDNYNLLLFSVTNAQSIIDEIKKENGDLYDINIMLIKGIAGLLYAALNLDLTKELTINKTDAAIHALASGHEGC